MLNRTALIKATDGTTAHTSTWAVYRMVLIKIGGIRLASDANIALSANQKYQFEGVTLERVVTKKSRRFD